MRRIGLCLFFLTIVWAKPAVTGESDNVAKSLFLEGNDLFNNGQFVEAAASFRKAYETRPSWKLWFNIGQAEAAAKHYDLALEAFEKYLAQGGDEVASDRSAIVIGEIRRFRELVGFLRFENGPDGAEVFVDDIFRAVLPLVSDLRITAGVEHVVTVTVEAAPIFFETLTVGSTGRVVLDLAAKSEKDNGTAAAPAEDTKASLAEGEKSDEVMPTKNNRLLKVALWTSGALTVAAGGATLGFWLAAGKKNDEFDQRNELVITGELDPSDPELRSLQNRINSYDVATTAFLVGTCVFAVSTGIIGGILIKRKKSGDRGVAFGISSVTVRF